MVVREEGTCLEEEGKRIRRGIFNILNEILPLGPRYRPFLSRYGD